MNRIYRLVWNRTLQVLQVASELTRSHAGGVVASGSSRPHGARRPLFLACAAALALGSVGLALPAWAANTYVVTQNVDDGLGNVAGSLSWAIAQANTNPGSTIEIALTSDTAITETGTLLSVNASTSFVGALQVVGPGAAPLAIFGATSVLQVGTGAPGGMGSVVGNGGAGGNNGGDSVGYLGVGGVGVDVAFYSNLTVGQGSRVAGGSGGSGDGHYNSGGWGGSAVLGYRHSATTNNGRIDGGVGGNGGAILVSGQAGYGGRGGAGFAGPSVEGFILVNSGIISGGRGGTGGHNYGAVTAANQGGAGGVGVAGLNFDLGNNATINGGNGGDGGNGGNGGNGVAGISGSRFALVNTGTVQGGDGGIGGPGSRGGLAGDGGNGGVGVVSGRGSDITNAGTIAGGRANGGTGLEANPFAIARGVSNVAVSRARGGVGTAAAAGDAGGRADAVNFTGGGNTMTLESGYRFIGNVVSTSDTAGGGDTLILGGSTSPTAAFNVSNINASLPTTYADTQYVGFAQLAKTGTSTWTLTGAGQSGQNWTIVDGTLAGDATTFAGNLTFAPSTGGTAAVVFDHGSGNTNSEATATYAGAITGDGSLTKVDDGTMILTGANTFSGGTTISAGILQVGNGGTSGSIGNGDVANAGTLVFDRKDDLTFGGAISGGGALTQQGAGVLTLNGNSSAFTGATTVAAGTLIVGDAAHAGAALGGLVTVASGATLSGIGTLASMLIEAGATLSPSGGAGHPETLVIAGSLSMFGTLDIALYGSGSGNFDVLNANDVIFGNSSFFSFALGNDPSQQVGDVFAFLNANSFLNFAEASSNFGCSDLLSGLTCGLSVNGDGNGLLLTLGSSGIPSTNVPGPGSLGMMGLGLLLLGGGLIWRKRRDPTQM